MTQGGARIATRFVVEGGTLVSFDPPAVTRGDILIENGVITKVARRISARGEMHRIDAHGKIVMPGLVSAQTRLALDPLPGFGTDADREANAAGRQAARARAHDEASIICSAFSGAMRALRAGTTCVIDSHSSPAFVDGAARRLREVLLTVGLRAMIGYRVAADEGDETLAAALDATNDAAVYGGADQLRFSVAAGDVSAFDAKTLSRMAEIARENETPFCAEIGMSEGETAASKKRFKATTVARLEKAGLLGPMTILRTGPWLDADDGAKLAEAGVIRVGCPEGDVASGRPLGGADNWLPGGALGTDDGTANVFSQARLAWQRFRADDPETAAQKALDLVVGGHKVAERLFGLPFSRLEEGSAGDVVVLDYHPSWPLNASTIAQHLVSGFEAAQVNAVMVNGRLILREGAVTTLDEDDLVRQLQRGALDFWTTFAGTTYPGWEPQIEEEEDDDEEDLDESGGDDGDTESDGEEGDDDDDGDGDDDSDDDESDDGDDDSDDDESDDGDDDSDDDGSDDGDDDSDDDGSDDGDSDDDESDDGDDDSDDDESDDGDDDSDDDGSDDGDDDDDDGDDDDDDDGDDDDDLDRFGEGVF